MNNFNIRSCNDDYCTHFVKNESLTDSVTYFNNFHKTNFSKQQIENVYWLTDIYSVTVPTAIKYYDKCHLCGVGLCANATEFCSHAHQEEFNIKKDYGLRFDCCRGNSCELCNKPKKTENK